MPKCRFNRTIVISPFPGILKYLKLLFEFDLVYS